jgi:hypothetical protein
MSAEVVTWTPMELPYVAAPIVKPLRVMLIVESAGMYDPLDNIMKMRVAVGASQVANEEEELIQILGVTELEKKPDG